MNQNQSPGYVRAAAVAGRFYPADPRALRREVERFLASAVPCPGRPPQALIAPHAGYLFSGPIAGSAFAAWASEREAIRRVVLCGPAHFLQCRGLALPGARAFATPLGEVPVDLSAVDTIGKFAGVARNDRPHQPEHSLEVELPFLQVLLRDVQIVPILVGEGTARQVADVLEALWGDDGTRVVISSDLSHYLDYRTARELDESTARSIEALEADAFGSERACGWVAIQGLMLAARRRGLVARTLDLRNSGDTAGARDRVVGYGAFAFQSSERS